EILSLVELLVFLARENALLNQILGVADAVVVFADPEQRVEVAQATLAFLDVRLDDIAGVSLLLVSGVAFGKLGLDELRARALDALPVKAVDEVIEQLAVAADVARFQDGGADGHVAG